MFLSRLILDPGKRSVMQVLAEPQKLHGMIEMSFKDQSLRKLWRLDTRTDGKLALYVQAAVRGDLAILEEQLRADKIQTASMDAFLAGLEAGQRWHFRLRANPTHSERRPGERRGKVYGVKLADQQGWLLRHAPAWGIQVDADDFLILERTSLRFRKHGKGKPVRIDTVTYEGALEIADAQALRAAIADGVGRAKAYGCGLLTLAR